MNTFKNIGSLLKSATLGAATGAVLGLLVSTVLSRPSADVRFTASIVKVTNADGTSGGGLGGLLNLTVIRLS
jgi:hypothetical protein